MTAPMNGAGEMPQSAQIASAGAPAPAAAPGPAAATPAPTADGGNGKTTTHDWERDAKTFQSRLDQTEAEMRPIREAMRKFGLDPMRVANSMDQLAAIWTHPDLGPVAQQFLQTGKYETKPSPAQTAEESYRDPDVVALEAKYEARINELEKRLGGVSQTSQMTASTQVAQTLRSYASDFKAKFPLSEDESKAFDAKMSERFDWMVDKQPQALVNLQRDTYEDLAHSALARVTDVLALGQRVASQKQAGAAARATDARLRAPTTGTEVAPVHGGFDHTPTQTEIQSIARAALDQIRRERGER